MRRGRRPRQPQGDERLVRRDCPRLAFDVVAQDDRRDAGLPRRLGRRRERSARRGDDAVVDIGETRVARLRRFAVAAFQIGGDAGRRGDPVFG